MSVPSPQIKLVNAQTFHSRHGPIKNDFRYRLDCLLLPVHARRSSQTKLLSLNSFNLFSFFDGDHGDDSTLDKFVQKIVDNQRLSDHFEGEVWLLTQPRILGYVFNPVSFWFFLDTSKQLRTVIAEVNNTVKGRHFYVCRHDDYGPIRPNDKIMADKLFYVSPFQSVAGHYTFRFQFDDTHVGAWINYKHGDEGVFASLTGRVAKLGSRALIKSAVLRPLGAFRVISLIHWQALKLKLKGGRYQTAPVQNEERISR